MKMDSLDSLTYRSVYGGSLVFTYFQLELCECWISPFMEFCIIQRKLYQPIVATVPNPFPVPYSRILTAYRYDTCVIPSG